MSFAVWVGIQGINIINWKCFCWSETDWRIEINWCFKEFNGKAWVWCMSHREDLMLYPSIIYKVSNSNPCFCHRNIRLFLNLATSISSICMSTIESLWISIYVLAIVHIPIDACIIACLWIILELIHFKSNYIEKVVDRINVNAIQLVLLIRLENHVKGNT